MTKNFLYCLIIFFLIEPNLIHSQTTEELDFDIISIFPSPGPSPQGLAWDSTNIWLSDDSTDLLYKIDPSNGTVLFSFDSPGPIPKGLTFDGENLWNLDDSLRKIFKLNPENGWVIDSIDFPKEVDGILLENFHFTGLTWDGLNPYTNFEAGWSSQIIKINVYNDSAFFFSYTTGYAKGLTFDGDFIWNCSDRDGNGLGYVRQYNSNGMRCNYFYTPGYYPTGITYIGTSFWIADNELDSLYGIRLKAMNIEIYKKDKNPCKYVLYQNYPNPFNSSTMIKYKVLVFNKVSLKVYDYLGKEIMVLVDEYKYPGSYEAEFENSRYASGCYFYVLKIDNAHEIKEMIDYARNFV